MKQKAQPQTDTTSRDEQQWKNELVRRQEAKEPLFDRQQRLWAHAEAIERAQMEEKPLPPELSKWLHRALKNIACGTDAEEVFNVKPSKKGVRKDGFKLYMRRKVAGGFVAAASGAGPEKMTNTEAFNLLANSWKINLGPKASTVRKEWNKKDANRNPVFTLGGDPTATKK